METFTTRVSDQTGCLENLQALGINLLENSTEINSRLLRQLSARTLCHRGALTTTAVPAACHLTHGSTEDSHAPFGPLHILNTFNF